MESKNQQAKIDLLIEGPRGTGMKEFNNKGRCSVLIDTSVYGPRNNAIIVDAFTGSGKAFKRRYNTLITVCHEGDVIFAGSFYDLVTLLEN